jgi:hypothetical protein
MGSRGDANTDVLARVFTQVPTGVSTAQQLLQRTSASRGRPVVAALQSLFPRGGLEPGAIYECRGQAAVSFACAAIAASTQDNAWACFFHLSSLNMHAVADLDVALHRVVSTTCSEHASPSQHAHVLAALVEGFDFVVAKAPRCTPSAARAITARAQRHGSTVLLIGQHSFRTDAVITANATDWMFSDRLVSRRVHVVFHDRHQYRNREIQVLLPNGCGGINSCTE